MENRETQNFDLSNFLKEKPHISYDKLIQRQGESDFHQEFVPFFLNKLRKDSDAITFLKNKLHGRTLIDLGGGSNSTIINGTNFDYEECPGLDELNCGPDAYIGVDKYFYGYNNGESTKTVQGLPYYRLKRKNETATGVLIEADMLQFLTHVPDGTANVSLSGVDYTLIRDSDYHNALANEIERVCEPGGIVFGYQGYALGILSSRPSFRIIRAIDKQADAYILEKVESSDQIKNVQNRTQEGINHLEA